jgi:hypothetical protein
VQVTELVGVQVPFWHEAASVQRSPSVQVVPFCVSSVAHAPALHVAVWQVLDDAVHGVQVVAPHP